MAVTTVVKLVLVTLTLAADAFYVLSIIAASRFFKEKAEKGKCELPPVTIMVPLHGADYKAYENYATLCSQDYPQYQVVFGTLDRSDSSIPVVKQLISDLPGRDIQLVVCPDVIGENLKVSNLQNMLARVKNEHIVILDSDIRVGPDYLRRVIPPLLNPQVGIVTCLYRAAEAPGAAAILEAIGISAEFAAGVLAARLVEGVKFALGSTMATTRTRLEAVGGFQALANYLADDFMLGNLIAGSGYEVRLSRYVVETMVAPSGFYDMVKHQMRWARSTRISRPLGYLGLILTYGTALALMNVAADGGSTMSLFVFGSTLAVRMGMGWLIGVHWLGDRILRRYFWLLPVRDIMSLLVWCLGMAGRRVEWRGSLFEIVRGGQIVRLKYQASPLRRETFE